MGKILLFYKYVAVKNPQEIADWQRSLCTALGVKGRIILATEGINATVGGSLESIESYKKALEAHPLFGSIDFKESDGDERYFPRLRVMIKKEIVRLGIDPAELSASEAAPYVSPQQAHDIMSNPPENLLILDTRNDYEIAVGTFNNAVNPNTRYFKEFPEYIDNNLGLFKDKQVLMVCTGGVRCERASAYLKKKEIAEKVMHIEGGIHRYVEQFPDGHFRGSNYVFDARITQQINNDVLSTCSICSTPTDFYVNCNNAECNRQFLCCAPCEKELQEACSRDCFTLVKEKKVIIRTKPARVTNDRDLHA